MNEEQRFLFKTLSNLRSELRESHLERDNLKIDLCVQYEMIKEIYRFLQTKDKKLFKQIQNIELEFYKQMHTTPLGINDFILSLIKKTKRKLSKDLKPVEGK